MIEIETVYGLDDEGPVAFYAKGHWPTAEFVESLRASGYIEGINLGKITRDWWRCVPLRGNIVCEIQFKGAKPHTQGAFPVTAYEVRKWE